MSSPKENRLRVARDKAEIGGSGEGTKSSTAKDIRFTRMHNSNDIHYARKMRGRKS